MLKSGAGVREPKKLSLDAIQIGKLDAGRLTAWIITGTSQPVRVSPAWRPDKRVSHILRARRKPMRGRPDPYPSCGKVFRLREFRSDPLHAAFMIRLNCGTTVCCGLTPTSPIQFR